MLYNPDSDDYGYKCEGKLEQMQMTHLFSFTGHISSSIDGDTRKNCFHTRLLQKEETGSGNYSVSQDLQMLHEG